MIFMKGRNLKIFRLKALKRSERIIFIIYKISKVYKIIVRNLRKPGNH